ncbi:MAG TPA: hypothetical protein VGA16_03250 [Candidatus Limnocylindria bacterium]
MAAPIVAARDASPKIPWFGWVGLAIFVVGGLLLAFFTHRDVVSAGVRWAVTGAWVLVTVALGLYDFFGVGSRGGAGEGIDVRPVDRWTIAHTGAGLVFGVWFLPFVVVLPLVVLWEVFESLPTGFGQGEIITNRLVDIGVALVGWIAVTAIAAGLTGASIPWA